MKAMKICLMGILFPTVMLKAQSLNDIKPVGIGQLCPDVQINNIIHFKVPSARISDFRGKVLILDFWATWCGACLSILPEEDSLQKQFEDRVQFLPVDYEKQPVVTAFLERYENLKHIVVPTVTDDQILRRMFPHTYLPHFVWIDSSGIVRAITGLEQITEDTLQAMLDGHAPLTVKADYRRPYDDSQPFLMNGNGGTCNDLLYHSVLTGYMDGLLAHSTITMGNDTVNGRKFLAINYSIAMLFARAFCNDSINFMPNRINLNVKDSNIVNCDYTDQEYDKWLKKYGFCYELEVPRSLNSMFYLILQTDLLNYFRAAYGISAAVQKQEVNCWALVRTSAFDKIHSKGGVPAVSFQLLGGAHLRNEYLDYIPAELEGLYMQNSKLPIINESHYLLPVDIDLNANLSNMDDVNAALAKYDLQFVRGKYDIDMLVITQK